RESAARDDPVEDLDALAAGQLDDVERAVPGERLGVRENVTEAEPVVVGVDMAGALAVELVRQAAGAEHHDPLVARPALERAADRAAQLEAPLRAGQRVLHGVDADRHELDGPGVDARPAQLERDRHAVVDRHGLAGHRVELVGDDLLDDVPRQLGVARIGLVSADAPALVLVPVFGGAADREGRHLVEEEVEPVVVVDHHRDVGPLALEEAVDGLETVEERLPVRLLLHAPRDRGADSRHVAGEDTAHDDTHVTSLLSLTPRAKSADLNSSVETPVCSAPRSCTLSPRMPASLAR